MEYHNMLQEVMPKLFAKMFDKVQLINNENKVAKKVLHFAFLFANPLMTQTANGLKEVPQLNYHKEYDKIKERLDVVDKQIFI
jgi:hypothetical protein